MGTESILRFPFPLFPHAHPQPRSRSHTPARQQGPARVLSESPPAQFITTRSQKRRLPVGHKTKSASTSHVAIRPIFLEQKDTLPYFRIFVDSCKMLIKCQMTKIAIGVCQRGSWGYSSAPAILSIPIILRLVKLSCIR